MDKEHSQCNSLSEIIILSSVTKIEWKAFGSCKSLQKVTISTSVLCLRNHIFDCCSVLNEIIFENDSKLTWLLSNIKECNNYAFKECFLLNNYCVS